jgi:geranylgeranyl pyrophosphate synthase
MKDTESVLADVNSFIRETVDALMPHKLREASMHLITGGKMTRSALVFFAFKTISRSTAIHKILPACAAIEMIHTASLVHDDIIDKSDTRRGIEAVHEKYSTDYAILVGDIFLAKAYSTVGSRYVNEPSIINTLSETVIAMTEGESMELEMGADISWDQYMAIAGRKTGKLVEMSTKVGAQLAGGSDKDVEQLARYGYCLGVAFQIQDDILDKTGGEEVGKPTQHDAEQNKPNAVDVLGGIDIAIEKANEFADEARSILKHFEDSYGKDGLLKMVDFVVTRDK